MKMERGIEQLHQTVFKKNKLKSHLRKENNGIAPPRKTVMGEVTCPLRQVKSLFMLSPCDSRLILNILPTNICEII